MSWAEEDWTVGLSGRVLQKVKELQVQQERLSRENKQKQLQLDNIHTSYEKQTVKYEEVRVELQSVQRELQSVRDEAKAAVTSCVRLTQELQTKQAQVCSLEGQLDSARTINNKLSQEVKRLEAELEKLQNSCRSADTTLFSTPCWNAHSPWEQNGSRKEERSGQRDEGPSQALHIRQRLQFSDMPTASLPRQQYRSTPQSESFSTPLAAFPWERDDSKPAGRRRSPSSPQTPLTHVITQGQSEQEVCGRENNPRDPIETDKTLSEIRSHVSSLEEELSVKDNMLKATQGELLQCKKELTTKELNLQTTHTRIAQESERASGAEQRLKQLQEELKCYRQNAESSRLQHQQRVKDLEKQHQRDLIEFQKERQCLEKQHQQEMNKLNQELQQARTLHNALQAQVDKLSLQKQALDKELDTLKEKLKWTEGQLQESLKKEAQTQAKLTEAVREAEGVAVSLEQSKKRERALEEEGRRLAEERADALRLLKELQEQKPAPPLQPVQFCSVGQSLSTQPSHSLHSRPSTHTKKPTTAPRVEWKREEEDMNERASYPTDREPGEGIDSEHITVFMSLESESLQKGEHRKKSNEEENKIEAMECDSSGTSKHSTFGHVMSTSSHSVAGTPTNTSIDDHCSFRLSAEKNPSVISEQTKTSEDLKGENAMLRSELRDVQEELQKRLEDLETQRRAETEARTRLKQLSRKRTAQAVEKEEQDKGWRVQLESERAEIERLRKGMAALQTEIKRNREEREKERDEQEEEKNKALEERETEMIELNIQLKKQLTEVKAQLALEREERKREEEERNKITNKHIDLKKTFSMKMAELKAELEEVKQSTKRDVLEEDKLAVANSPLTYLTLHDDELNSNITHCDNKHFPLPEQHVLLCQSTNQRNTLVSQATADLIQECETVSDPECSPVSGEGQSGYVTSAPNSPRQNCLGGSSLSEHRRDELASSDLAKEVERLQKENVKEMERANQYQVKLEALQSQVTRQTQQLTMAFEKQSQHISGLLAEVQEKESALLSQGEELQHYKQELDALKAKKEQEERKTTKEMTVEDVEDGEQKGAIQDERSGETSELPPNQENECAVSLADDDSNAQREIGQPKTVTSNAETPTSFISEELSLGELHSGSVNSDTIQSNYDSACVTVETEWSQDGGTADVVAELLALKQENQLLKQRIETLTVSTITKPASQASSESQAPVEQNQNTGNAAVSCLMSDITAGGEESLVQTVRRMTDEEKEEERTTGTEEEPEDVSERAIDHLEQQVVALQLKLWALSEQTQQQAEELAVWRLASQPAPTFDQILPCTNNQSETQGQISSLTNSQPNQQHADDVNQAQVENLGHHHSPGKVTVTREDELFLSCSSNKLQGCMLFSRLQHSNLSEPKFPHPSKKMSVPHEYSQDTANIDKESEKENQEISFSHPSDTCPPQYKDKTDVKLIQMSSEKTNQQPHVSKELLKGSGTNKTKQTESQSVNPDINPNACRQISEINKTNDSSSRDFSTEMKSVSSQTEDSLYPRSAPVASELHCVYTQTEEEEEDEELVASPPVSPVPPVPLTEIAGTGDKMLFSGSFPIPADPARLAERIRRNRTQLSAAFDDTEYEPYGLPEVVMKGFADIPSGPSCPYIVRRGLLGTAVVPASQKDPGQEETD